ncbi:rhodanese-like domain-containing protein [Paenibacillus yanchengensis]|uniref:Rhodanese-like domain-containing protein n=1 Tax=Paenibacillus yanchengensis TaxID=2035833 RepID=A0ABW4YMM0_9BACL
MYNEISAAQLQELLKAGEKINLIDVREPDEWAEGHIDSARLIPLSEFQARAHEVHDEDGEIIVICKSGGRSSRVCEYLSRQGYEVTNVHDGMLHWAGNIEA